MELGFVLVNGFRAALEGSYVDPKDFREIVQTIGGAALSPSTPSRWFAGTVQAPPCAQAIAWIIRALTPEELGELTLKVKSLRERKT